jgi:hypothetical protein
VPLTGSTSTVPAPHQGRDDDVRSRPRNGLRGAARFDLPDDLHGLEIEDDDADATGSPWGGDADGKLGAIRRDAPGVVALAQLHMP